MSEILRRRGINQSVPEGCANELTHRKEQNGPTSSAHNELLVAESSKTKLFRRRLFQFFNEVHERGNPDVLT